MDCHRVIDTLDALRGSVRARNQSAETIEMRGKEIQRRGTSRTGRRNRCRASREVHANDERSYFPCRALEADLFLTPSKTNTWEVVHTRLGKVD